MLLNGTIIEPYKYRHLISLSAVLGAGASSAASGCNFHFTQRRSELGSSSVRLPFNFSLVAYLNNCVNLSKTFPCCSLDTIIRSALSNDTNV